MHTTKERVWVATDIMRRAVKEARLLTNDHATCVATGAAFCAVTEALVKQDRDQAEAYLRAVSKALALAGVQATFVVVEQKQDVVTPEEV